VILVKFKAIMREKAWFNLLYIRKLLILQQERETHHAHWQNDPR
jgi:hypothetical protein